MYMSKHGVHHHVGTLTTWDLYSIEVKIKKNVTEMRANKAWKFLLCLCMINTSLSEAEMLMGLQQRLKKKRRKYGENLSDNILFLYSASFGKLRIKKSQEITIITTGLTNIFYYRVRKLIEKFHTFTSSHSYTDSSMLRPLS